MRYAKGDFAGIERGIKWAANLHLFAIESAVHMNDSGHAFGGHPNRPYRTGHTSTL